MLLILIYLEAPRHYMAVIRFDIERAIKKGISFGTEMIRHAAQIRNRRIERGFFVLLIDCRRNADTLRDVAQGFTTLKAKPFYKCAIPNS